MKSDEEKLIKNVENIIDILKTNFSYYCGHINISSKNDDWNSLELKLFPLIDKIIELGKIKICNSDIIVLDEQKNNQNKYCCY